MIWDKIYIKLSMRQYNLVTRNASLKYDNYFHNILKHTKSKQLHDLARLGLNVTLDLVHSEYIEHLEQLKLNNSKQARRSLIGLSLVG